MSRKRGGTFLLFFGVLIAAGVAFMVFRQAQTLAEQTQKESVDVLVAAQDIPERTMVAAPFLVTKRMLPGSLPPAAMNRPEEAVGKMTNGPILAGDFILPGKLAEADGRAGLTYAIPKGKVVITLPASDILTTGAVRSGDHVDLLVTIKPPEQQQTVQPIGTPVAAQPSPTPSTDVAVGTTQMTMQNLKVLAIGSVQPAPIVSETDKTKSTAPADRAPLPMSLITFAVDRQDALTLKALKDAERVKLELVLRAAGDEEVAKTDAITINSIVDRYRFKAVPTPRAEAGR